MNENVTGHTWELWDIDSANMIDHLTNPPDENYLAEIDKDGMLVLLRRDAMGTMVSSRVNGEEKEKAA